MKRLIILYFLCLFYYVGSTQDSEVKAIGINDTVPNIPFVKYLNEKDRSITLQSLRGKLVILDFWNVGCTGCIAGMPKMDSLQKAFGDKIQIIYITKNTKAQVEHLFSKIKVKKPDLPMVVEDSLYYDKLFPHEGDPLHVWIGKNGVVDAITWGYNTTAKRISSYFEGTDIRVASRSELDGFTYVSRLSDESNGRLKSNVTYHSILMKGLYEKTRISSMFIVKDSTSRVPIGFKAVNKSILSLFSFAFSKDIFGTDINMSNLVNNNRIILAMDNPEDMFVPVEPEKIDDWKKDNILSYEVILPEAKAKNLYSIIQDDLNRLSDYSASLEKRKVLCLVLKLKKGEDKIKTSNLTADSYVQNRSDVFIVRNMPISKSLFPALLYSTQSGKMPVIDQTNYSFNIDLVLHSKLNNVDTLSKELERFNLLLVKEVCEIEMLIIRKRV
ncbi:MAG: TlpA disulfide reductase family protein [Patescibacteria group bacterium]